MKNWMNKGEPRITKINTRAGALKYHLLLARAKATVVARKKPNNKAKVSSLQPNIEHPYHLRKLYR